MLPKLRLVSPITLRSAGACCGNRHQWLDLSSACVVGGQRFCDVQAYGRRAEAAGVSRGPQLSAAELPRRRRSRRDMDVDIAQALVDALGRDNPRRARWTGGAAQQRVLRGEADGLLSMSIDQRAGGALRLQRRPQIPMSYGIFVRSGATSRFATPATSWGRRVAVTPGGLPSTDPGGPSRRGIVVIGERLRLEGFARLSAGSGGRRRGGSPGGGLHDRDATTCATSSARDPPFATLAGAIAVKKGQRRSGQRNRSRGAHDQAPTAPSPEIQARWRPHEMVFVSRAANEPPHCCWSGGATLVLLSAAMAAWVVSLKKQIRAQHAAQSALERVRLLAQALQSASDCISITDTTEHLLYVNQAFLSTYGYEERELLGQHISIVRAATNAPEVSGILPLTTREGWRGVVWNQSKQGRVFPVSLVTSKVADERNRIVAAIGVARDTTKELEAAAALRASEEKFFKIFQASPDCVAIVDYRIRPGTGGQRSRRATSRATRRSEIMGRSLSRSRTVCRSVLPRRARWRRFAPAGCIRRIRISAEPPRRASQDDSLVGRSHRGAGGTSGVTSRFIAT